MYTCVTCGQYYSQYTYHQCPGRTPVSLSPRPPFSVTVPLYKIEEPNYKLYWEQLRRIIASSPDNMHTTSQMVIKLMNNLDGTKEEKKPSNENIPQKTTG